ncbi:hypothetical protein GXP67_34890 [Rhodocytophaga rosea]|uniref:Uncharacterized protein n=1 Tax=Rhodocytophaga rosea TaxID=2704465 RepID=A0A6C0GTI4_9BACT|nr:hypothetical protein [Rhodocytophaga rosea]QHT71481.1 hypothetical protein GXP67_34890 [Rhodocytophaga rosea]
MMRSKYPFQFQSLRAITKIGIIHISASSADASPVYDVALRYTRSINNRFAFKINVSYLTGMDNNATYLYRCRFQNLNSQINALV